jgi:hypothetical protein
MINYFLITFCIVSVTCLVNDNELDEVNTVFYEVPDSSGTIHHFNELLEGSTYCFKHLKYEQLVLLP